MTPDEIDPFGAPNPEPKTSKEQTEELADTLVRIANHLKSAQFGDEELDRSYEIRSGDLRGWVNLRRDNG